METIIGLVESKRFRRLWPKPASVTGETRLTSIQPMESVSEESGELDLTKYEDKIIAVRGVDQGGWVYAAEVIDSGGAIAKTLALEVFAKPTKSGSPFDGLEVPGHEPVSEKDTAGNTEPLSSQW